MIAFTVVGNPRPQGSKRALVNRHTGRAVVMEQSGQSLKDWRRQLRDAAAAHAPNQPLSEVPVAVRIAFRMPVPRSAPKRRRLPAIRRPDIDKLTRAVLDAGSSVLWHDDALITRLEVTKELAYDAPVGCDVTVEEALVP